ncbi:TadE/TadG family type IV pilus assembly protein [Roseovarius nitratireducens]|uniref:TadE/TadG family type IV pilus assembly protein n=1 Tax=Roseovarius nitratireducens TaxID=2044597 RepID=UPI000CE22C11|nr:TadE/TadG family type IV pilus assembly protein [Roseovarius nitratireducens]
MTLLGTLRACFRRQSGAVAIEFAFIALPLVLLLGGSIEIGRYVWTRLALQDAASTGARCLALQIAPCFGAETMDLNGTVSFVREQGAAWAIVIPDDSITAEETGACQAVDDFAKIGIRYRFAYVLAILPDTWISVEACFPVMPSE